MAWGLYTPPHILSQKISNWFLWGTRHSIPLDVSYLLTPFQKKKKKHHGAEVGKTNDFLEIACYVLHPMFKSRFWLDKLHWTQNLFAFGMVIWSISMYSKNLNAYWSRKMPNLLHKKDTGADSVSLFQKVHHPMRNEKLGKVPSLKYWISCTRKIWRGGASL